MATDITTEPKELDIDALQSQFSDLKAEHERFLVKYDLEKNHRKKAESALKEIEKAKAEEIEAARAEAMEQAKKGNKTEELDKSWREKYDADIAKLKAEIEGRDSRIKKITAGREADSLASEVFGDNASVMMPHISPRVTVEFGEDGKENYRYLDEEGRATAYNRSEFADILKSKFPNQAIGSKASGGGANGSNSKGSAQPKTIKRDEFFAKPEAERRQLIKDGVQRVD